MLLDKLSLTFVLFSELIRWRCDGVCRISSHSFFGKFSSTSSPARRHRTSRAVRGQILQSQFSDDERFWDSADAGIDLNFSFKVFSFPPSTNLDKVAICFCTDSIFILKRIHKGESRDRIIACVSQRRGNLISTCCGALRQPRYRLKIVFPGSRETRQPRYNYIAAASWIAAAALQNKAPRNRYFYTVPSQEP